MDLIILQLGTLVVKEDCSIGFGKTQSELKFSNVLDVFGGTASVSLLFKKNGKTVYYNDLLKFNQIIGKAIIENNNIKVTEEELDLVFKNKEKLDNTFIQDNFSGAIF